MVSSIDSGVLGNGVVEGGLLGCGLSIVDINSIPEVGMRVQVLYQVFINYDITSGCVDQYCILFHVGQELLVHKVLGLSS